MTFINEFYDPKKVLFFDLNAVYDMDGVVQKWHRPEKQPGVLKPEKPWEGDMTLAHSIVPHHEEDKLVCYYQGHHHRQRFPELVEAGLQVTGCLAYSADGIHWERPELGLRSFRHSTANNLLPEAARKISCLVMDPHDPDAQRRYKGLSLQFPSEIERIEDGRKGRCYYRKTSADGIHWSEPVRMAGFEETGDTQGLCWDERAGVFRFTTRKRGYWMSDDFPEFYQRPIKKQMPDGRWVAMSTTQDFETFSPLDNIIVRDPMDEQGVDFYCAVVFPYGPLYLGFLRRHHFWHGLMDTELIWSYDCVRWNRSWYRRDFLGWGELGEDDWCFGNLVNCKPFLRDGQLYLYYETRNHVHAPHRREDGWGEPGMDGQMGLARLREDGFVSLEAGRMGGSLISEPLPLAGRGVTMNARTVQDGFMEIRLMNTALEVIAEPLFFSGDELAQPLCFNQQSILPQTDDRTVRLEFRLKNAALYNLRTV